jgi:signal transduction histidine kinase/CheY-like chemotaxis protein
VNTWVFSIWGLLTLVLIGQVVHLWRTLQKTEQQKKEIQGKSERLVEQLARAQRFEAVGIMAGSIVHNLNNLMSVILGHTRMVAHDLPADSPSQNGLQHVVKAGHMAADLLNEISDFNRQAEQDLKPTDLSSLLRNTLKFLRDILPSSIKITENIPERCEPVMASATGVQQVLMNLISNSVQAIGKSPGKIEVGLQACVIKHWQDASPQKLGPGSYIKLTVRDNGQGMDSETLDGIIGAYFESPPNTTRLGLGLNTVFRILDQHDGVTIPTSKAGQGTSFDIYFPKIAWQVVTEPNFGEDKDSLVIEKQSPAAPRLIPNTVRQTAVTGAGRPIGKEIATILLVDDEEMVARVTTLGLQKLGYRVVKHLDSRRALADFAQTPEVFDVVITDQIMPHMSGVSLARKIHSTRPNIPVILMTGFRDSFNEKQALEAGITQVVLKPTSHRDLADIIEKNRLLEQEGHS